MLPSTYASTPIIDSGKHNFLVELTHFAFALNISYRIAFNLWGKVLLALQKFQFYFAYESHHLK